MLQGLAAVTPRRLISYQARRIDIFSLYGIERPEELARLARTIKDPYDIRK